MKNDSCKTSSARSLNQGQAQIEYVTIQPTTVLNTVTRDMLVQFRTPHKFFFVASMTNGFSTSSLFVHFAPLGLTPNNGGNVIQPTGGENWIPIANAQNSTGRAEGRWFRFAVPVQSFLVDVDHAAGTGGPFLITFGGTDDIEEVIAERQ